MANNDIKATTPQASQVKGRVQLIEGARSIDDSARGRVQDHRRAHRYLVERAPLGGWLHIDTEPLTKEDTAKMKRVHGGSWSWNRRAVWAVASRHRLCRQHQWHAARRSGHQRQDFDGHHCIHFYKSKATAAESSVPSIRHACWPPTRPGTTIPSDNIWASEIACPLSLQCGSVLARFCRSTVVVEKHAVIQ